MNFNKILSVVSLGILLVIATSCGGSSTPAGENAEPSGALETPSATAKAITTFRFETLIVTGTITESTHTIAATVPTGTDVTALIPTITHTGASISPASGVTQDFTNPIIYTVTAADSSTQTYTVAVTMDTPTIGNSSGQMKTSLGVKFEDVDAFIINTPSSSSSMSKALVASGTGNLVVVLKDETLQEIPLLDGDGPYEVLQVIDTDTYVFFSVQGVSYNDQACTLIPVRKIDGAMFCLGISVYQTSFNGDVWENPSIQKIVEGDIFYVRTDENSIVKLELTDPANATQSTPFNFSGRSVRDFTMNANGDALIWNDGSTDGYIQVFKKTGGILNIAPYHNVSWAHLVSGQEGYTNENDFFLITDDIFVLPSNSNFLKQPTSQLTWNMGCSVKDSVKLVGKIFVLPGCGDGAFYELPTTYSDNATQRDASDVVTSATNIYGLVDKVYALGTDDNGNGGIVRYNIESASWTVLLTPGDYTVSKMSINSDGSVLFFGIRNSDAINIIGKAYDTGVVRVISEQPYDMDIQSIVRINSPVQ